MKNDSIQEPVFAPVLYSTNVAAVIEFYIKALDAKELRRWSNDDGSVHVAEMAIGTTLFHLHEEVPRTSELSPKTFGGTPVVIGLFVSDPDKVMAKAIAVGAIETNAMQDYDYGYRQGGVTDPSGHHWVFQKAI